MGLTLIELVVSLAILTIIGFSLAIGLDIGIRTYGAGGAGDRTQAARDVVAFEQDFGEDVGRAVCLVTPTSAASLGSCSHSFSTPASCIGTPAYICVAFAVPTSPTSYVCHQVTYAFRSTPKPSGVIRTEVAGGVSSTTHVTVEPVTIAGGTVTFQTAFITEAAAAGGGYTWVTGVGIPGLSASNPGLANPVVTPLTFHPFSRNPASALGTATC